MDLDFVTNQEVILAARQKLDQAAWDYLVGGSESETTMRRNRLGFDRLAFRPRILVDVSEIDPSTTFLGHHLRIPVLLAPMGSLQTLAPEGGVASARAAEAFGTVQVVSTVTQPSLEDIAVSTKAPKIFQLYVQGDWDWLQAILERVKAAGYVGLALTVDNAIYSRRERPLIARSGRTVRPGRDPRYQAMITWELLDRIKEFAGLPFLLKGVATAEDAATAVQHGADVIWVSNHGGRQLDHGRGTVDVLPEIVQAVDGKAQILLDGGVLRGSDVLKAVALGANAVAIGKLQGWGLGAGGTEGLVRVLEILEEELIVAMGLLGVTRLDQLTAAHLCTDEPVMPPHEMSAFPSLPGGVIR